MNSQPKTLYQMLERSTQRYPNRTALLMRPRFRTQRLTYDGLLDLTKRIAAVLKSTGLKKGDRLMIWAPNSPEWVATFFACHALSIVTVPMDVNSTTDFLNKVGAQTSTKLLVKAPFFNLKDFPSSVIDLDKLIKQAAQATPVASTSNLNENDLCEIIYTSGTTGDPKGVMLTHKNFLSDLWAVLGAIKITKHDCALSVLPLSHTFEQTATLNTILSQGASIVYAASQSSPAIARTMREFQPTKLIVVPQFLSLALDRIESQAKKEGRYKSLGTLFALRKYSPFWLRRLMAIKILKAFGRKLNLIAVGGSALDPEVGRKWEAFGINVLQGYGATETSPVLTCNRIGANRFGTVGQALPGIKVKTADDGEILAKGPNISQGYWQNNIKTKSVFIDGWYHTGDMGSIDSEGFLIIRGRKDNMIVTSAGLNIYPEDIETKLNKYKEIDDCCVVGLDRSGSIEIHAVFLPPLSKARAEEIVTEVNKKLASHQRVQAVSIWPFKDFPRSIIRKVKRREVIDHLDWQETHGQTKTTAPKEKTTPLVGILSEITKQPEDKIQKNTNNVVKDLRLDSLQRIELIGRIEDQFGIEFDETLVTPKTTLVILQTMIDNAEKTKNHERFQRWPLSFPIRFIRPILQWLVPFPAVKFFAQDTITGRENLRGLTAPVIFMPNHTSPTDAAAALLALPPRWRHNIAIAAARDYIYTKPILRTALMLFGNTFAFSREKSIRPSLDYLGKLLDRGWNIMIFPEGYMSEDGHLQPLKNGAGLLALEMNAPIVPIKLTGLNRCLAKGHHIPSRCKVTYKVGKPIDFSGISSYIEATEKIEKTMRKM